MNVGSICKRDAVTIDHQMTLHDAAKLMRDEHVGSLVVTSSGPNGTAVVGIVTDRDLTIEVLARGRDGAVVSVGALVTGRLVGVSYDADVSEAIAAMEAQGVRRLIVTGEDEDVIGVVSLDDVIEAWATDMSKLARSIRRAREREGAAGLPASLTAEGGSFTLPEDALVPAWQRA